MSVNCCAVCGSSFKPYNGKQIYCTPYCRETARNQRTLQYKIDWKKKNALKSKAANSKYRAKRKQRLVNWDLELTSFVTEEAHHLRGLRDATTGLVWHVDHIIPMVSSKVSGLHVWNNLQVIPAKQNLQKRNKFTIE